MPSSTEMGSSRAFGFACATCGWEMTAMVLRLMAGPPPADDVIAACPQGHYCEYRREPVSESDDKVGIALAVREATRRFRKGRPSTFAWRWPRA